MRRFTAKRNTGQDTNPGEAGYHSYIVKYRIDEERYRLCTAEQVVHEPDPEPELRLRLTTAAA